MPGLGASPGMAELFDAAFPQGEHFPWSARKRRQAAGLGR
jgi:hypothetical protein